jgi:hypothetical protein
MLRSNHEIVARLEPKQPRRILRAGELIEIGFAGQHGGVSCGK